MPTAVIDTLQNHSQHPLLAALVAIGGIVAFKFTLGILSAAYKHFLRPAKNLRKLGKYAVVTGATDGIGKAYAFALAKQGLSVVIISRTESKLQEVAKEIDAKNYPGVEKTKYIVCDYSKFDDKARANVSKELEGLEIAVLVNNVGQSYRYPRFFHELANDEIPSLIEMNINSTVWMTKFVLEGMVERKKGTIVNLSSGSADYTMPLLAEYAAAKMFVERFSESLDAEYRAKGVTVQCQVPFYVATKLAKMRKSLTVPSAEDYVKMAMKWVGQGDVVANPFWLHAVQGWVMHNFPKFVVTKLTMDMHLGIRKRGLKKDAKIAAEGKKE
eukprot:CAMPEP_0171347268 /NCGR_PEP_ID=MMETSP0878-20121228/27361_1 /TAXON_ID=67004 /ORGANISM="Thalassiosira weissflogii, Strain CCMP1336" /LENGTH=327 /DNA_ID=CAMNT_0011851241 /DNA_START=15 /DNA_END=998 /DNA_ORIENTATION=+